MKDEFCLSFESLRHDGLSVTDYKVHFRKWFRHALGIIPNKNERIHRFVIRSAIFWTSREGASFQSIVNAAKDGKLIEREEFRDPKMARISIQFHGASFRGRGSQRVSGSFKRRRPIHASMPTFERG